jgi:hypothetical protein
VFTRTIRTSDSVASPLDRKRGLAGQSGRDEACWAWQLHVAQRPAEVVYPESTQHAVSGFRLLRQRGQRVTALGTGHQQQLGA